MGIIVPIIAMVIGMVFEFKYNTDASYLVDFGFIVWMAINAYMSASYLHNWIKDDKNKAIPHYRKIIFAGSIFNLSLCGFILLNFVYMITM
ncbi:hypothetical protein WR164_03990 [Philodulcilactobacillus myokoensis]|uniref:Uncharacterized protein n=1 Tax=Philodulcilactobacillus myokoensis TaxID=2929573 RepID=A0A9W6AZZ3_9LACO|nr:hypothetical protein [Philodulcilactobacillus myokoensis]GLB46420.1 hypothetical protein WR164_03990 [Philodulcilactobacillus myokoensis]